MSRRANCWDNAVAESFFSTLKMELAYEADWATKADARADVSEYLEIFYNRQRRHSALGYLSPVAFERHGAHALLFFELFGRPGHRFFRRPFFAGFRFFGAARRSSDDIVAAISRRTTS